MCYNKVYDNLTRRGEKAATLAALVATLRESAQEGSAMNTTSFVTEQKKVHNLVTQAIRRGELSRPDVCEHCGSGNHGCSLDAHHKDYSKPLDVIWLCRQCHSAIHSSSNPRKSPKLVQVIQHLLKYPEDMNLSSRDIAEKVGVSHTWVSQAKRLISSGEYKNVL